METAIFIMLIVAGLIFLAIEFFLVPGFSIPGIAGIGMIIYGIYRASNEFGIHGVIISVAASLAVVGSLAWLAVRSRSVRAIGLEYSHKGATSVDDYSSLVGRKGTSLSTLRPAGIAIIDNRHCDVVTDGEYIEKDSNIIVREVEGSRIVVTKYQEGE